MLATTASHIVVGSIPYMSPEQLTGARWAADLIAALPDQHEALSGLRAREGTPAQVKHQALEQSPPDLREFCPRSCGRGRGAEAGMAATVARSSTRASWSRSWPGLGAHSRRGAAAGGAVAVAAQRTRGAVEIQEADDEDGSRTATGPPPPA